MDFESPFLGVRSPFPNVKDLLDVVRHRVLDLRPDQQSDVIKLIVRYRIAKKAPWFVPNPCQSGATYCIRTFDL